MEFKHTSVLLEECIENLNIKPDGIYVDGTLGGGGHSAEICRHLSEEGVLIGIDRDRDALAAAKQRLAEFRCRQYFVQSNYSDIKEILRELDIHNIDGALLDLGVSSFQLDNSQRGFSYMHDAPLDMRMNQDDAFTAFDVVNGYSQQELARIISAYGEEKWAGRIASFIVNGRKSGPIETTGQLTTLIKAAIPAKARREGPHPAKRTFQAIRIEVNDELGQLGHAVEAFCDVLSPRRQAVCHFFSFPGRPYRQRNYRKAGQSVYLSCGVSGLCMRKDGRYRKNFPKTHPSGGRRTKDESKIQKRKAAGL